MEKYKEGEVVFSIRKNGQVAYITSEDDKLVTEGFIGENTYDTFIELIKGIQGFNIEVDDFFW